MYTQAKLILMLLAIFAASSSTAQSSNTESDDEELKMAALEALMAAPSDRALPIVIRVIEGNGSDEMKESALFILSQIDHPDASAYLTKLAQSGTGELRLDTIRMIGINGGDALNELSAIYASGDSDVR
jgi:HEAT repeat protein